MQKCEKESNLTEMVSSSTYSSKMSYTTGFKVITSASGAFTDMKDWKHKAPFIETPTWDEFLSEWILVKSMYKPLKIYNV